MVGELKVDNFGKKLSHEKKGPNGWLGDIKGMRCTTQLNKDYFINHEIRIPIDQPGFNGK